MEKIVFIFPGNEQLAAGIDPKIVGDVTIRSFPDGESFASIRSEVADRHVYILCSLNEPDKKIIQLYFLSQICRHHGANKITLVCPYLAYMRQDKIFNKGEGLSSKMIAELISGMVDSFITIDPHLHRINALEEIFTIPCRVLKSADHIAEWIRSNVKDPVVLGPDSESAQWVRAVAGKVGASYDVLIKNRRGDRLVEVSLPLAGKIGQRTPVLVDDIVSTGKTMIKTIEQIKKFTEKVPVVIAIHPVFSGDAYAELRAAGALVKSCNTIRHTSNAIDLSLMLASALNE